MNQVGLRLFDGEVGSNIEVGVYICPCVTGLIL